MSFDNTRYLFFYVKNYTNTYTTTGYTLPITPFTFIPVLDTGDGNVVSNTNLMWHFGDGTTSTDITATHAYSVPGTYNITCHLYSSGGQGYESSFTQSVFVKDYITDSLALCSRDIIVNEAGHYDNPFTLYRFNSWQTYPTLGVAGATIMFYASGTGAPLFDAEKYAAEKYAHLKPYARFLVYEYNSILAKDELNPVDKTKSINNAEIYVRLKNNTIVPCLSTDIGSTLAGTSGDRLVFFTDDIVQASEGAVTLPRYVYAMVYFDSTELYDNNSYGKSFPKSQHQILRQIVRDVYTPTFIDQGRITRLSITSNGIDGEGSIDESFGISRNKYVSQKVPFVIRIKDDQEYTTKSANLLRYTPDAPGCNQVKIQLLSSDNTPITAVQFYEDFGEFENQRYGGFFKGYFQCSEPVADVHLFAEANICGPTYFLQPTYHTIISQPQSKKFHLIDVEKLPAGVSISDTLIDTPSLTGTYTTIVVPSIYENISMWAADADRDIVYKCSSTGSVLLTIQLPKGASPSNMVADESRNVWVSLYDGVSTVKLEGKTGNILAVATPPFANVDYTESLYYMPQSGHAGQNLILPTSVETDRYNDLWVSYSNPLCSVICKYDSMGVLLSTINAPEGLQPTEIITTHDRSLWVVYKDITPAANDKLCKITTDGDEILYDINMPLWNITCDTDQNIWATAGRSELVYLNSSQGTYTTYYTITSDQVDSICEFAGIGCTTDNMILVIDDARKCMHYFDVVNAGVSSISAITTIPLQMPDDLAGAPQNILNAYGDWTGFRYINKYLHHIGTLSGLEGESLAFNVYPASGVLSIGKKNENFNAAAQYQAYVFQEPFADYTRLMTDFLGTAAGDKYASHEAVGKRTYEKISNFVDNINNIDTCNLEALKSLHRLLNENFYTMQSYSFNYPSNIARLVDLFSIKFSKLRGSRNKYATNFNSKGFNHIAEENNTVGVRYGRNRGVELDIYTTILTGGVDGYLVAFEKFSEQYHMVCTNLPKASYIPYIDEELQTYALSSYDFSGRWGWGLVLPSNVIAEDLDKYYTFYQYVNSTDDQQVAGLINWSDPNTTIMENISAVDAWNTLMEDMITYTLAEGLELLSATVV
jgi:hypothetical protein